ncbi:class I SAM-dependent methyltransferase [Lysinibacillus sp. NPDC096418]|uniref:class I SAM-dependent methyltransferase n=1 Tax=Lysinibacillus sp. NPDC096418 TaxID=3364138 RepID=UPI00381C195F
MIKISFLLQFLINPKTVGAVLPSSNFLGDRMIEKIDFKEAKYIVEYGPGTGVFTEKLIKKRNPKTVLVLVENNKEFYSTLKEKYKEENNLFIVHESAEKIERYLREYGIPYVDYVISGLPFASLPKKVSNEILLNTTKILKEDGQFITFQYTKIKKAFFNQFFTKIDVKREYRNFPPAYIFSCTRLTNHTEEFYNVKNTNCG